MVAISPPALSASKNSVITSDHITADVVSKMPITVIERSLKIASSNTMVKGIREIGRCEGR